MMMTSSQDLLTQLTLEEKAALCSGLNFWFLKPVERLGLPSIMLTDGPHGLRKQATDPNHVGLTESVPATCFPTASCLAATWNRALVYQVGVALGEACRQERVGVILGPGANLKRSPLCGRNFEYFSEDPYLTGEMAASHIQGVQSQGVGASLKHFAVNNQETRRMTIDAIVDERALRELYLRGFEIAVRRAQPWTVMCAYNRINGVYASDHSYLMTEILRHEWGFQGLVITDWGALNDPLAALKAGVELQMPGPASGDDELIVQAVRSGQLQEAVLDRAVGHILDLILKAQAGLQQDFRYDEAAQHALARQVAAEGAVLLKNEGGLLPLPEGIRLALVGRFAREPRYQGAGSSLMCPTRLDTLYEELRRLVGDERLTYAPGYTATGDQPDEALIQEALSVAAEAEAVIVCAGLPERYEVEGLDRPHLDLPAGHNALIQRLAAAHPKVVVVLSNGAPVTMPWVDQVPAILEGYLGGQAGGGALADLLTGRVNPSGKLAETFPQRLEDVPAQPYPGGPYRAEYRESLYVGYRYYDTAGVPVLFPFGHGLSYTTFTYRDLRLSLQGERVIVTFTLENSGARPGQEVAQLYVRKPESAVFRPDKELKGFTKVALQPGEAVQVALELDRQALAIYDVPRRAWVIEAGEYEILIGASSRDIRLRATLTLPGEQLAVDPAEKARLAAYYSPSPQVGFRQADFAALLGRPLTPDLPPRKGAYTLNTPIGEMRDAFLARLLFKVMNQRLKKMVRDLEDTPTGMLMRATVQEMPLRAMLMLGGSLTRRKLQALLQMINGQFLKGLLALFKAR